MSEPHDFTFDLSKSHSNSNVPFNASRAHLLNQQTNPTKFVLTKKTGEKDSFQTISRPNSKNQGTEPKRVETNPYGSSPVASDKRLYDSTIHLNLNFQPKVLARKNKHFQFNRDSTTGIDGNGLILESGKDELSADLQESTIHLQSRLRYKHKEQMLRSPDKNT